MNHNTNHSQLASSKSVRVSLSRRRFLSEGRALATALILPSGLSTLSACSTLGGDGRADGRSDGRFEGRAEGRAEGRPEGPTRRPRVGLALGGGAARGFAHVGVIKTLESHQIKADLIVGTSAGSFVGALYASGMSGYDLQKLALEMDEAVISDWSLPSRGLLRGEALAQWVNRQVGNRPIERLTRPFAAVATDLRAGEPIIFQRGDTGTAVRASSAVPGVFQPVTINGREYVDGGLVSPIPVRPCRKAGADFVIAVDISSQPQNADPSSAIGALLQTFTIMGAQLGQYETADADVVIRPRLGSIRGTDFSARNLAILEGERATLAVLDGLRQKLARWAG